MFTEIGNSPYSDVDIVAGFGENRMAFAVHKYKLATHSNVFRDILENAVDKTQRIMIVIDEFSPAAVRSMLVFIYSGSISLQNMDLKEASDVMKLAQKYNIPALTTMCERDLIPRVWSGNVIDCFELADFHQASYLYEHCLDFIGVSACEEMSNVEIKIRSVGSKHQDFWDDGSVGTLTMRTWYRKFRSCDFELEYKEGRGRPKDFDDDELKALVEALPKTNFRHVFFREFKLGRSAAETSRNIG
ncbi:unnamed protein product [Angiostrongylus costaricensis]|uniref:BTB domain-containing protein n=1 Tax=Angiostrongylus costaricensis TaxID=334426 RepID=A0A0R3Q1R6_ANGCS|nr:unnamed protein product [Angiostrongylus costaricensis]